MAAAVSLERSGVDADLLAFALVDPVPHGDLGGASGGGLLLDRARALWLQRRGLPGIDSGLPSRGTGRHEYGDGRPRDELPDVHRHDVLRALSLYGEESRLVRVRPA